MKIEKRNYSSNPWRLVSSKGLEVSVPRLIDHPDLGQTQISTPIMGNTRRECEAQVLELLEDLIRIHLE